IIVLCLLISLVFFFFQAEDGIRDRNVTGVQTCALPIYSNFPHGLHIHMIVLNEIPEEIPLCDSSHIMAFLIDDRHRLKSVLMYRSEERRVGKECRFRWAR